jgi:hypothetical protein
MDRLLVVADNDGDDARVCVIACAGALLVCCCAVLICLSVRADGETVLSNSEMRCSSTSSCRLYSGL